MGISTEQLTDHQQEILKEFRRNVADVTPPYLTDAWLIKWLKVHNFKLRETERFFRGTMLMRQLYEMDSLVDHFVRNEAASKYEFTCFLGMDKKGSPIRYTRVGDGDLEGFLLSLDMYEVILYCSYHMEYDQTMLRKENKRTGREVNEITYILDLDNFSLTQLMSKSIIEVALDLVQLIQDHYPEVWGNIFIVNAPSYFDKIFNLFKPIIKLNMLRKIKVTSQESTPHVLLKYIDEDVLPAFLGGKRVDSTGNPRCTEFVKFGGRIPEELYLRNQRLLQPTDMGVTSLWVYPRAVFNHSVVVKDAPCSLHVQMRSENGSIGLKLMFRELGESPDVPAEDKYLDDSDPVSNVKFVSPLCKVQTHITPIDKVINVPWRGIYIFRFDNTSSWFTSRKIIFRIRESRATI